MTEKIAFPPKPDGHTYRQTDCRLNISVNRVASLLQSVFLIKVLHKQQHNIVNLTQWDVIIVQQKIFDSLKMELTTVLFELLKRKVNSNGVKNNLSLTNDYQK